MEQRANHIMDQASITQVFVVSKGEATREELAEQGEVFAQENAQLESFLGTHQLDAPLPPSAKAVPAFRIDVVPMEAAAATAGQDPDDPPAPPRSTFD